MIYKKRGVQELWTPGAAVWQRRHHVACQTQRRCYTQDAGRNVACTVNPSNWRLCKDSTALRLRTGSKR
jgi:hypothetical protein